MTMRRPAVTLAMLEARRDRLRAKRDALVERSRNRVHRADISQIEEALVRTEREIERYGKEGACGPQQPKRPQ
jgi:hypothetical protein